MTVLVTKTKKMFNELNVNSATKHVKGYCLAFQENYYNVKYRNAEFIYVYIKSTLPIPNCLYFNCFIVRAKAV